MKTTFYFAIVGAFASLPNGAGAEQSRSDIVFVMCEAGN